MSTYMNGEPLIGRSGSSTSVYPDVYHDKIDYSHTSDYRPRHKKQM